MSEAARPPVGVAHEMLGRWGEVGADLLAVDWDETPLGPPETWPQSLSTAVSIMLGSRFPMWMAWGPELTFFCNDAYRRDTLGKKYPWALGRPAQEVWAEIWDEIGPRIDSVIKTGIATWDENLMLFLERSGYKEETYHTFSYSPLADDEDVTSGMLCVVSEETERVVSERQLAMLRELATQTASAQTDEDLFAAASSSLASNRKSLPWVTVYRFDEAGNADLVMASGIEPGHPAAPVRIEVDDPDPLWPIGELRADEPLEIKDLLDRFDDLPTGAWEDPPKRAQLVPLDLKEGEPPYGFMVAATNPYHLLYSGLIRLTNLIANHIETSLRGTRALRLERERAEQLAELDRAKTTFFTNVSHELRTPLTLMLGPAEDALTDANDPLDGKQRERVEVIDRNARRLLLLVNSLLDFSRAQQAASGAHYQPTDIALQTREVAAMFESAASRSNLELIIDCEPAAEPVFIDREMWTKIVSNLLSNAFKFTFEGSITVRGRADEDGYILVVEDTGTGIEKSEQGKLFDRFHRIAGARSRSHEGSGVGLALVAEFVDRLGGEVGVESTPGKGSKFCVRVPLGSAHLPQDLVQNVPDAASSVHPAADLYATEISGWLGGEEAAIDRADRAEARGSRMRLIVADDNADMRRYVTGLLDDLYDVTAVADGRAALEFAKKDPPDLILTDVMMPELDGFGLLRELRADPETMHIPVVMLSARAGEEGMMVGLEAGADDYLVKPFAARELHARVAATLELDRTRRARIELSRRQDLLDQAQRSAQLGSWEVDWESGAARASDEALRILGVTAEEFTSLGLEGAIERLVHPEDQSSIRDALSTGASGDPIQVEARIIGLDNVERIVRVGGESIEDSEDGRLHLRGSIQDITSQVELRRALAEAAATREVAARERAIADELQQSLVPEESFASPHLEVATVYRAGVEGTQVGGDWYDVIPLDAVRTALVIGDVMGRGVKAAAAMGRLRTAVRAYARLDLPPAQVVKLLEALLDDFTDDQFVTMVFGVHDASTACFTYVNAGHLPPVVVEGGSARLLESATSPPVAVGLGPAPRIEMSVNLPPGSLLVLYTDGLVERRDIDIDTQLKRLTEIARVPEGGIGQLPNDLVKGLNASAVEDDVAVLAAHVLADGSSQVLDLELDAIPQGVRAARQRLESQLETWGVGGSKASDAALALSELLTNAVIHGEAPVSAIVSLDGDTLRIEVRDADTNPPQPRPIVDDLAGGRGLLIIDQLSREWGVRPLAGGKMIWCVIDVGA